MRRVADEDLARLTDRDREVLVLLYRFHWLAASQLSDPWFPSVVAARHRLGVLAQLGLTRWVRVQDAGGAGRCLWGLTPEGARAARLLAGEAVRPRRVESRTEALLNWRHHLELGQLFVDLTRRLGSGAFRWEADREVCLRFPSVLSGPGPTVIWPDARVTLDGGAVALVEYDRGTMARRAMVEKFRRYAEYFRERRAGEKLLVIALDAARRRDLEGILGAERCPGTVGARDEILAQLLAAGPADGGGT